MKIRDEEANLDSEIAARSVITIKADAIITVGDGSQSTPWIIE